MTTHDDIDLPLDLSIEAYEPGQDHGQEVSETTDAETVTIEAAYEEGDADEPDEALNLTWGAVAKFGPDARPPILPVWLTDKRQRMTTLKQMGGNLWYYAMFHIVRSPWYTIKLSWYTIPGAAKTFYKVGHWAAAEEGNYALRQNAANKNDAMEFLSLDKVRAKESSARWWVVAILTVVALIAVLVGLHFVSIPAWGGWVALFLGVLVFGRRGVPADKGILVKISHGKRFTKLTAEMVRDAVMRLGIPALKDTQIEFVHPGIHRDGPGWLARFNCPPGLEAVKVIEKRSAFSSALRLPVDQVWPSAGPDHAGQVDLWVGYQPASKMKQPPWKLAEPNAITSVFEPCVFGADERLRPVSVRLFANNFLIGGQPGSGKSYAARALAMLASLDPTVQLIIAEFKGTGDFMDLGEMCAEGEYLCGVDDETLGAAADLVKWLLEECRRRGDRIKKAKIRGDAPEGKVTPELARQKGSGLHPITVVLDEVHELFGWDERGKEASKNVERAIKRGRALNIQFILATQIPDKESLPPAITRCVSIRWCLSVGGQVENDMILGTGMYKRGLTGTVYRPGVDAGWGIVVGLADPGSVRSQYPDAKTSQAMVERAKALRGIGGQSVPEPEQVRMRNMLEDVLKVLRGDAGQTWDELAARLREIDPEIYQGLTGDALREQMKPYGVRTENVKVKVDNEWRTLKGVTRKQIEGAINKQAVTGSDAHQLVA